MASRRDKVGRDRLSFAESTADVKGTTRKWGLSRVLRIRESRRRAVASYIRRLPAGTALYARPWPEMARQTLGHHNGARRDAARSPTVLNLWVYASSQ
jgi:hypothetical protein